MDQYNSKFKVLLGYTRRAQSGTRERIYLEGFEWACGWYWGGGCIGNKSMRAHFDDAFLEVPDIRGHVLGRFITPWSTKTEGAVVLRNGAAIWEDIETFLEDVPERISKNWWRIKDLFKQFYALRAAAEVFQYGGHCTSEGSTEAETSLDMATAINLHIATVIIPEITKVVTNKEKTND